MSFQGSESDDIVVTGIAGRFPKSRNVEEFAQNLYNKVDMTCDKEDRWKHVYPKVPPRFGKISGLEKFDAPFFSMLSKHAEWTDPQMRMLLEHAYEAILDAGVSPQSLMGSRTAVLVGAIGSDSKDYFSKNIAPTYDGFRVIGHGGCYLANRVSYLFGLCGPSMVIDTACSSSACALDMAHYYIKSGACDAAIVGGLQLNLNTLLFTEYTAIGILAPDGVSRPFDANASGFTRAESICAVFLQKRKDSKRVYAQLVHSLSNNDGFKIEGPSLPSREMQVKLMEEFYKQANVDTSTVKFVEAHATGTKRGDPQEVSAIDEVLCKSREDALTIGTVKANMGHAEGASGVVSISKIAIAFENSKFPPNINLTSMRDDIDAFNEGRIRVATDAVDIDSDYIAFNSFGLGGSNVHALFKRNPKTKVDGGAPADSLERLVLWSGRTEEALNTIFDDIASRPLDAEHIALLHNTQTLTPDANTYRGYGVFKKNESDGGDAICMRRAMELFDGIRRPVVFVYSGMGSQWHGMGRDLMRIPVFAESIEKCQTILAEHCDGFDLRALLESDDEESYSDIVNAYLGIVAIEIALTDMMRALGVKPSYIIGHSVGEIGCSYADGCFSAEEALTVAYRRGLVNKETNIVEGAMAAVGMHYKELETMLPQAIDIACHNSSQSTTISGPADAIRDFVARLKSEGVFAKEVQCAGIPFHSRYIAKAGEALHKCFEEIIGEPKVRSERWISSTYPEDQWIEEEAKLCGAKYQATNALNPVLFEEAAAKLPKHAIVVEIAPNGILKSIVKSLLGDCSYVCLTRKGEKGEQHVFDALGSLFQCGVDMNVAALYPPVAFPVSRGTPMISPRIKWNHSENHFVAYFDSRFELARFSKIMNFETDEYAFLKDHVIDGKLIVPGACYLIIIWKIFAFMHMMDFEKMKVTIKDVEMTRVTRVLDKEEVIMAVSVQQGSGHFEIAEGSTMVIKGTIVRDDELMLRRVEPSPTVNDDLIMLQADDFYKYMRTRGYQFNDAFRSVKEIADDGSRGKIKWRNNWVTFLDAMLQPSTLHDKSSDLAVPWKLDEVSIDPMMHLEMAAETPPGEEEILFDFEACKSLVRSACGGITIKNMREVRINRQTQKRPLFESHQFVPYFSHSLTFTQADVLKIFLTTFFEIQPKLVYTIVEVSESENCADYAMEHLSKIADEFPMKIALKLLAPVTAEIKNVEVTVFDDDNDMSKFMSTADIVLRDRCAGDAEFLQMASENTVFISRDESEGDFDGISVISKITLADGKSLIMFRRTANKNAESEPRYKCIEITPQPAEWLETLQAAAQDEESSEQVVLFSQNSQSGLLGFYNCLRFEFPSSKKLTCVLIDDTSAPSFDPNHYFYAQQLSKGLAVNIYRDGGWGAHRHINITADASVAPQTRHCFANYSKKGQLSTLKWREGKLNNNFEGNDNLVAIHYGSLNFKDVLYAHGYINDDTSLVKECAIGFEFSGVLLSTGERVMGMAGKAGCLSTLYDARDASIMNFIPEHWSLEEAATVPTVYVTVYYSFFKATKIQAGKSILIHSGSGGVGQAALHVAFAYGLDVFTTVGSDEKRKFLLDTFPQLKPEHIGNSRDTSFVAMIMEQTQERGVDYVLNSLSGEKMTESINCLARGGVLLEIGRADIIKGTNVSLDFLGRDIELKSIRIDHIQESEGGLSDTFELMKADVMAGIIKPIKYKVFDAAMVEKAFQFMSSGNHIGKVLIKVREESKESLPINVLPRFYCDPHHSFVMVGGLGGLGLEFSQWLVSRGCRKLVMSSSRGISNQYQAFKLKFWKKHGVEVVVSTVTITTASGCRELLESALELGPVGGIFNFAAVLQDGIFTNQTDEMFSKSLAPKAIATRYLHEQSHELCPHLKHFVVFSSISCGRGSAGQTNYGMANSIMEEIVQMRQKMGLPGKAIQWGPISDVGMLSNASSDSNSFTVALQSLSSVLESLDTLLTHPDPVVASTVLPEKEVHSSEKLGLVDMLMKLLNIEDKKTISMNSTFSQLGIDSLAGVEMQQLIEREYGVTLSAKEIRTLSLAELEMRVSSGGSDALKEVAEESKQGKTVVQVFFDYYGVEDLLLSITSTEMFVKLNEISEESSGGRKILFIPGIGGVTYKKLERIAASFNLPMYVIQFFLIDHSPEFDDLCEKMLPYVTDFFKNSPDFILVCYSFGTLVGLRMAKALEATGKSGQMVEIDGSPQVIYRYYLRVFPDRSDKKIHDMLLIALKRYFRTEKDSEKDNSSNIVELLKLTFPRHGGHDYRNYMNALINRFKMQFTINEIEFDVLERTKITLVRASENGLSGIHKDFGLTRYSKEPVAIETIEGDHNSIMDKAELVNRIKRVLV